jgi:wyosine [tRNA(Phe)-imidazoG37] synthetase (radical SAM superfamily)
LKKSKLLKRPAQLESFMTIPLQSAVIYGPLDSRRLGRSLGINILPLDIKFCVSDCIYCQYGRTEPERMKEKKLPKAGDLIVEIERGLSQFAAQRVKIDSITFSGNGEPTLHPEFPYLVDRIKELRDQHFPGVPVSILTDASQVRRRRIREALKQLDFCYFKLDAGTDAMRAAVNHPMVTVPLKTIVRRLKEMPSVILQSLFISAPVDNSSREHVERWTECVREIKPKAVHIYTIARSSADPAVVPAGPDRLSEIGRFIEQETGVRTVVIF